MVDPHHFSVIQPFLQEVAEFDRVLPGQRIGIIVADPGKVDVCQQDVQPRFVRVPVDAELVSTAVVAVLTLVVGVEPGRRRRGLMLIHTITSGAIIPCPASPFAGDGQSQSAAASTGGRPGGRPRSAWQSPRHCRTDPGGPAGGSAVPACLTASTVQRRRRRCPAGLGPGINQVPVFGRQFVLIKGVLTGRDAALLVTEKVEEAPADLPKGVGHQPPLLHSGRDRFRVVRKDLGEDQTPLLEEVAVVIAVDRDAETLKDAVDESRSLITV